MANTTNNAHASTSEEVIRSFKMPRPWDEELKRRAAANGTNVSIELRNMVRRELAQSSAPESR